MPGWMYQLKATIVGATPPVWRRLLVPEATTLLRLPQVLQAACGWWDGHLHKFKIGGVRYGTGDGEGWGPPPQSQRRARLGAVTEAGTTFASVYDFGDHWQHRLVVETILAAAPGATHPACSAGRRACPPEDCGGVRGCADVPTAIGDASNPEHDSLLEWVGGAFDPGAFDPGDVADRRRLGRLAWQAPRSARTTTARAVGRRRGSVSPISRAPAPIAP